ncbi:unnamed protein product [Cunninghamella blakesleeana]
MDFKNINTNNNNNNNNGTITTTATTTTTTATTATATTTKSLISPENEQQIPCEQYKEFLDASHNERVDMIDNLVDVSVDIIDSIWPTPNHAKVVATKGFIREILKRSKTTYFMLQISLFYIFRAKRVVQSKLRMPASERTYLDGLMCCGRRMFLASLMVASKYIHDKSYRNKAWADASGLSLKEINASELAFLQMIDYHLYVSKPTFEKWYGVLNQRLKQRKQNGFTSSSMIPPSAAAATNASLKMNSNSSTINMNHQQPSTMTNPSLLSSSLSSSGKYCNNNNNSHLSSYSPASPASSPLTQQQQRYARHQQQYPLNSIHPTSVKLMNGHMISVSSKNPNLKTPVSISPSRISTVTTAQYPSPASPCFYHPDFQLPT